MEPSCLGCGKPASELNEMWFTYLLPNNIAGNAYCIYCMAIMVRLLQNFHADRRGRT